MRKRNFISLAILLLGLACLPKTLRGQSSDEEKKRAFLQSRESIQPVEKTSSSGTPKPKPRPSSSSSQSSKSSKSQSKSSSKKKSSQNTNDKPSPAPKSTPAPERKTSPEPQPSADKKRPTADLSDDYILIPGETPEKSSSKSAPDTKPTGPTIQTQQIPKVKTPAGRALDAPILIEKSGLQETSDFEPPSKSIFGGFMKRWRYLSPSVRKAIDDAKVQNGRWKYIIVHNSGTRQGNARVFDLYHRNVRKMQNGLAYHFVIGNGNSSGNGEIEVGNRWIRQINGGHVASDYLNDIALGICLVGDLNRDMPTKDQLAALDELCTYLRGRVGKIKGQQAIVKGHKEINPKPTDCPGDKFPLGWLRNRFGN